MEGGLSAALGNLRMVRRYGVPEWMIAECTRARERGDWRAACEAARVTVCFDDADPVADMLAGLAPDLLRWHLPRSFSGTAALAARMTYVLAPDGPVTADTVVLVVRSPAWVTGTQRITLAAERVGDLAEGHVFPLPRYLWDARRVGELRAALRGFAAGPSGVASAEDPSWFGGPGADGEPSRAARSVYPAGPVEAWSAAGWLIDESAAGYWWPSQLDLLRLADAQFAVAELRRVTAQFGGTSYGLRGAGRRWRRPSDVCPRLEVAGGRHRLRLGAAAPCQPVSIKAELCLHPALLRPPLDVDLLRQGRIGVMDLHPLVRSALFPSTDRVQPRPDPEVSIVPPGLDTEQRFRVRCGGQWHWIGVRGGRLALIHHTAAERRRERALRAFGGALGGCFRAEIAWHDSDGAVPRRLRAYRDDLWRRMEHGGSRVVLALLDAGMDPRMRDGQGRTLLHRIHQFEYAELLPRLLAEGLDVNDRSRRGYTPMCEALVHSAPTGLLMALNEAGAHPPLSLTDPRTWPEPACGPYAPTPDDGPVGSGMA
ncbi:ankyrin repeat domain-containing protein [Catellatospora vulcania]|uniref:hypothetical protein n=1 Tax=Catellatospora vulcania TaxID=1460450 RepID=UPI0012D3B85B|nr:hypothetical protein [Catellatospora vulcania]